MTAETIFERHGGFAAIRRVVSDFYDRVLDSSVIGHHFEQIDMKRLLDHQARFISYVTGGPFALLGEGLTARRSAASVKQRGEPPVG